METGDLLYVFWSCEHGKIIMKPHVITNTHTCRYTTQTKVTQTTGTKHSSGTLFDWVIPKLLKNKGSLQKKKKKSRPTAKKPYLIGCMSSYLEIALWTFGEKVDATLFPSDACASN